MTARLTQKPVKTMLNKEKIKELLNQRFEKDIHKKLSEIPTPDALKDVFKGAERIKRAIEQNEKIVIVGDGQTSQPAFQTASSSFEAV